MRICVIAPGVIPLLGRKQRYGGLELIVSLVTDELARRGHDVYLFASGDSETAAKLIGTVPTAIGLGVSFEEEKAINRRAYEMAVSEKPDIIWDNTIAFHSWEKLKDESGFNFKLKIRLHPEELVD